MLAAKSLICLNIDYLRFASIVILVKPVPIFQKPTIILNLCLSNFYRNLPYFLDCSVFK